MDFRRFVIVAIRSGLFVNAKQSCRYGCPVGLRCKLWTMSLGIDDDIKVSVILDN